MGIPPDSWEAEWRRELAAFDDSAPCSARFLSDVHCFTLACVLRRPILLYGGPHAAMAGAQTARQAQQLNKARSCAQAAGAAPGSCRCGGLLVQGSPHADFPCWGALSLLDAGLTGVYLPLLWPPEQCSSQPLCVLFSYSHFSLLAAVEGEGPAAPPLLPLCTRDGPLRVRAASQPAA